MRNKEKVTVDNVYLGMRIKVASPTVWCEVPNHYSPRVWLKGRIIEVHYNNTDPTKVHSFTFNCKWKKQHYYFKVDRMWVAPNKETGVFPQMYKCK